jgi:hypothetical protein
VSLVDRDGTSADALLTDLYLDAVLAGAGFGAGGPFDCDPAPGLDPVARAAADRLRRDLVRVHPSFRFEERLATRLAEAATAMRLPTAVGAEGRVVPFRAAAVLDPLAGDPTATDGAGGPTDPRELARPLLIGGALTSAAISIAGAALVAWRRGRPGRTPMARAARAARAARPERLARLD